MTNKRKIAMTFASLTMGGSMIASAHMGDMDTNAAALADRFTVEASILGVTVDDVKNAWAEGKDMRDIAKEKGISEVDLKKKMDTARESEMSTKMQALVSTGVITQAQADKRMDTMKIKFTNKVAGKGEKHVGGWKNGFGLFSTTQ